MNSYGVNMYNKVSLESRVLTATPHDLITMLMEGALEACYRAKSFILQNDIDGRNREIKKAHAIITEGLQDALDLEQGGEVASNLNYLYDYTSMLLLNANVNNDANKIDETINLLKPIKEAWVEIKPE